MPFAEASMPSGARWRRWQVSKAPRSRAKKEQRSTSSLSAPSLPPAASLRTLSKKQREQKKREALFTLMDTLVDWLGGGEKSLRAAALHLARTRFDLGDRQVLYKDLLRSQGFTGFGALADAIRLYPQMLKLTRGGFYFKRAN